MPVYYGIVVLVLIILAYYSYLTVNQASNVEFILEEQDMGSGVIQQKRFKLDPAGMITRYTYLKGPIFGVRRIGAMKHRVDIKQQNIGVNIAFPENADYGIAEPQLVPSPVYGLARIAGFYRISDGDNIKWLSTATRSDYGDDITEYAPTKNLNQLPLPLY